MKKFKWELVLILIVAMWGLSFSLTKPLLSQMGVFNFLSYRFVIGGVVLTSLLTLKGNFKPNKEVLKASILSGILLFAAFYCHIEGLKYTTISKNAFIVGSSVIFIPIVVWVLNKEKSSKLSLIQMVISVAGLALITLVGSLDGLNYGDMITLLGTFIYAFYTVVVEKSVRKYHVSTFTALQLCTVGVLSVAATASFETFNFNLNPSEWINILVLAVLLTGVFYYLLALVQKSISAATVSVIFTLEPFFATLFGWMIFREVITINTVIGGMLIVIAVLLPYMPKGKNVNFSKNINKALLGKE